MIAKGNQGKDDFAVIAKDSSSLIKHNCNIDWHITGRHYR